jgi:hypothetical protein
MDYKKQLFESLDLVLINKEKLAEDIFIKIGNEISDFLFIIDPYLDHPTYFENLIRPKSEKISNIKILFNDFKCSENGYDIDVVRGEYYRYFSMNRYKFSVELKTMYRSDNNPKPFHDRYVITKNRCWSIGSLLKDIGKKTQSYIMDVDYNTILKSYEVEFKKSDLIKEQFLKIWDSFTLTLKYEYEEF